MFTLRNEDLIQWERKFANWEITHPILMTYGSQAVLFVHQEISRIVDAQMKAADRVIVGQERVESGIDKGVFSLGKINEGIEELCSAFYWGIDQILWQLEQQHKTMKGILDVLQKPLDTQAKELRNRAETAYRNGLIEDAIQDFKESETKNRYDFTIHMNLGCIYLFEKRNPTSALEYFEKAVKYAKPQSLYYASIALLHIGFVQYFYENFQASYNAAKEALELSPKLYEAHYQCAQYCANLGRYDEAITHLSRAIKGDRYYCTKADTEKDFNPMKEQLHSLFKELQETARVHATQDIADVERCFKFFDSLGDKSPKIRVPKNIFWQDMIEENLVLQEEELKKAKKLLEHGSLFNCLDAISMAQKAKKLAVNSLIKYFDTQMAALKKEKENQRSKWDNYKHAKRWNYSLAFFELLILGPIGAILIGFLLNTITQNFIMAVFGGLIGYLFCTFGVAALYNHFTDKKGDSHIEKINDQYKSKLELLEKKRSELERIISEFKRPIDMKADKGKGENNAEYDKKHDENDEISEEELIAGLGALFNE